VHSFFVWLEATALSTWIRESTSVWAFPAILSLHTIGMGFVAGLNAAVDLRVLGFAASVPLLEMKRFFPVMWAGFWVNAVSGILLLIAYPTKALTNPVFYIKMAFILVAVIGIRKMNNSVFGNMTEPRRAKTLAIASLACWTGAITAGRLLAYTYSQLTSG
jgi:uncharacterized oligopeptide transporter (OPT) family protein